MQIKFFSEFIEKLGSILSGINDIKGFLINSDEKNYRSIEEIYCLINTTLSMVILRLRDIIRITNDGSFLRELKKLEVQKEWLKVEKNVRFCSTIIKINQNTKELIQDLADQININEIKDILKKIDEVFKSEEDIAEYIAGKFKEFSSLVGEELINSQKTDAIKLKLIEFRNILINDRRLLVRQESELNSHI